MTDQSKTLQIAAELESLEATASTCGAIHQAAFELRRLHKVNVYLKDVYESLVKDREDLFDDLAKVETENERLRDAVAAEREACARVCEAYKFTPAAEAIRARGKS